MELLNRELILKALTHEAAWCGSHAAKGPYLGMGLLYYTLTYVLRAELAVCLGSGGGFVPRMMRQAQRDLGISDRARTILVDANRPEAGWGAPVWLPDDSFFRRAFPDIELVMTTTTEAVENVFRSRNLRNNYLHIDADHSFEACLGDFRAFRPFLSKGSVVTLHDTSFPSAGVGHVIEYLRSHGDCEVVDFADIGCGTAVVRITSDPQNEIGALKSKQVAASEAISVARKPGAPALAPPSMGWKYLESKAFATRCALAAHFVRDCPAVVEIGCGRVPIENYLTGEHRSVLVVDPFLRESSRSSLGGRDCAVRHVRARFQDVTWEILRPREYALVMLGLELQDMSDGDWEALYGLVDGARVTVLEFPTSWPASCRQFDRIRCHTRTRQRFACKLDLSGNDVGSLEQSWPPRFDRELHVLEPAREA
jgi:hypothetical protein